ncbi:hypothetical protein NONO_c60170 [Nocardia nova SH22a]|uniref:Uncharacterized protein n=1 Tax=Nocardia nova SH22a TaxID=1415166 RepID=W5TPC2_9NOCA|nr:hypothetical protein [Nocardia nova]AHH20793.1 hypothetical protein NONO_c60170 [Nocardia nova SH22a]
MPDLSAADIAELRSADAALPPGPWFPRLNDLIGGWCVMAVDSPPSEAHPTGMIADFTSDHAAAHIARMRNHLAALLDAAEKTGEAVKILEYALHLRMYGERAPGGNETWQEFDRRCETFIRSLQEADPDE